MVGRSPERLLAVGRACRRGCVAQITDQFRKQKSRQRRHSIPQQPNRLLPLLWMRCCAGFSTSSWASLQSRRSENGATDARAACRSGWTVPPRAVVRPRSRTWRWPCVCRHAWARAPRRARWLGCLSVNLGLPLRPEDHGEKRCQRRALLAAEGRFYRILLRQDALDALASRHPPRAPIHHDADFLLEQAQDARTLLQQAGGQGRLARLLGPATRIA